MTLDGASVRSYGESLGPEPHPGAKHVEVVRSQVKGYFRDFLRNFKHVDVIPHAFSISARKQRK